MKSAVTARNRTGASRDTALAEEMVAATQEFPPSSEGDAHAIAKVRVDYTRTGEPIGTMPPPAGLGKLAKTAVRAAKGAKPMMLLDKLGERAAFERSGTRLYDALISKHEAGLTFSDGPSRDDLAHIRDEEHSHFMLVSEAITQLGGDPTVVSPSANIQAVAAKGWPAVLADPRTNVLECLEAILAAELVDNDSWTALIELVENAGETELAARFEDAKQHELEHLERVRTWLAAGSGRSTERARGGDGVSSAMASIRAEAKTSRGLATPKQTASSTTVKRRNDRQTNGRRRSTGRRSPKARHS